MCCDAQVLLIWALDASPGTPVLAGSRGHLIFQGKEHSEAAGSQCGLVDLPGSITASAFEPPARGRTHSLLSGELRGVMGRREKQKSDPPPLHKLPLLTLPGKCVWGVLSE